ncbi:hypothetical protein MMC24_002178 [Lignoscripta atroalba]|nr:hypothetical protein [Lignoscripta atroalba]
MANPSDDTAALQSLFTGLRSNSSRSYAANSRQDENTGQIAANRESYSFDFTNHPNQGRVPEQNQYSIRPSSFSSPLNGIQSRGSGAMSPHVSTSKSGTPAPSADQSNMDRTANLLSLLKFNQPTSLSQSQPTQPQSSSAPRSAYGGLQAQSPATHSVHGRGISASDLVASFMGKPPAPAAGEGIQSPPVAAAASHRSSSLPQNPQDFLLQLLNRPKPVQTEIPTHKSPIDTTKLSESAGPEDVIDNISQDLADASMTRDKTSSRPFKKSGSSSRKESPIRIFGSEENKQATPFEPKDMPQIEPQKEPIFTYVNPFEELAASSPRNARSRPGNVTPMKEIHKPSKLGLHNTNGDGNKRKPKETSPGSTYSSSRRKLTPGGNEILESIESPGPAPLNDGRTQIEALIGIGAPTTNTETVAQALNEVGEQVDRQVEHALAEAEKMEPEASVKDEDLEEAQEATLDALEENLRDIAAEVKEELDKDVNKDLLESSMSIPMAEAVKDVIDVAAEGRAGDNWESADWKQSHVNDEAYTVYVYNFPMRPFVSIDLKQDDPPSLSLRDDAIMEIARLKKEFDQIDRTLATATHDFILYAMPKIGGLRIIRQEDGTDRQIFRETRDRIFTASISTAPQGTASRGLQTIIATAVSGSVYWATVARPDEDVFESEKMEQHGLAFPPVSAYDENTSGGQLKTRAKRSSRHPEYFAIGRGKSIQIIFPEYAKACKLVDGDFVVDTEKYMKERSLKINTGKAGKDFTFSEDDSMIITLDKAGRLRFWDIRDLVNEANATASKLAPIEIKTPLLTFATGIPSEKSWPTSVLFVDKLRPYTKGIALRYVIVGMKQNHTLQLWDLGLGKAVQELNFPHEKESDAICSVLYHPASGIVVVGHPTRNSIYFIHLSAPKYNLPAISQAKFVQRLANKDSTLPKPESTAIMSGMREFSFSSKGQLRSLDLLPATSESSRIADNDEDPVLFELYAMHSKGVTCLSIKKEDLGWSSENKVLHPVDAEDVGLILVKDLREPQLAPFSEPSSVNGDATHAIPAKSAPGQNILIKDSGKKSTAPKTKVSDPLAAERVTPTESSSKLEPTAVNGATSTNMEKSEKKKKKRAGTANAEATLRSVDNSSVVPPAPIKPESYAMAVQRAHSPNTQSSLAPSGEGTQQPTSEFATDDAPEAAVSTQDKGSESTNNSERTNLRVPSDFLDKELKKIENGVSSAFSKVLGHELDDLYRRIEEDKRIQDAAGSAKQDAVLRLVSSTLSDNVDKALSRIIGASIQQVVLPAIANVAASTLDSKISEVMTQQLHQAIPGQLKLALPEAVSKAMRSTDILRALSDQVTSKVTAHVEKEFSSALHNTISPAFKELAVNAAQKMSVETERRVSEQLQRAEIQHRDDNVKIDQLTALVRGLSETVHTMAAAQSEFQTEILKLQQRSLQERRASSSRAVSRQQGQASVAPSVSPPPRKSPEQEELEDVTALMTEGRYEEGTVQVRHEFSAHPQHTNVSKWLHSSYQVHLFDSFFVKCNPAYLQQLQPLVILSVSAAVTASLESNVMERLEWLDTVFSSIDPRVGSASGFSVSSQYNQTLTIDQDPDLREVIPRIMDVLTQRLEGQFMTIAETDPHDPVLRKIPPLTRRAKELKLLSQG